MSCRNMYNLYLKKQFKDGQMSEMEKVRSEIEAVGADWEKFLEWLYKYDSEHFAELPKCGSARTAEDYKQLFLKAQKEALEAISK
jgi:DNA polymerase/3'-5' exonuclease PolX